MLTVERLQRLTIELIFVLLGLLLIWLGVRGPIHGRTVDRHSIAWLILSVIILLWGWRGLPRHGLRWDRWENWTGGLSLVLLGILMLAPCLFLGTWI